jgi:CheY-like chemotaxis protein
MKGDAMSGKRILVIDDNGDSQDMIGRILRHYQIDFDLTDSAEGALDLLAQQPYKGLVIDLALPKMDGWTLLERIRENPDTAHVLCVAVTAYHSAELAAKAVDAGFTAFFPKPLQNTAFAKEIQRITES